MPDQSNQREAQGISEADCKCGAVCRCQGKCPCGPKCACNPRVKQDMAALQSVFPTDVRTDVPLSGDAFKGTCTITSTYSEPGDTRPVTVPAPRIEGGQFSTDVQ